MECVRRYQSIAWHLRWPDVLMRGSDGGRRPITQCAESVGADPTAPCRYGRRFLRWWLSPLWSSWEQSKWLVVGCGSWLSEPNQSVKKNSWISRASQVLSWKGCRVQRIGAGELGLDVFSSIASHGIKSTFIVINIFIFNFFVNLGQQWKTLWFAAWFAHLPL